MAPILAAMSTEIPLPTDAQAERSLFLALSAARAAYDNHGHEIVILDMRGESPLFDYFVIATGTSRRQLHAMSEEIDRMLEGDLGDARMGIEGYNESHWILLDYGTVVIHLFDEPTRSYYSLESLWADAPQIALPWAGREPNRENPKEGNAYPVVNKEP